MEFISGITYPNITLNNTLWLFCSPASLPICSPPPRVGPVVVATTAHGAVYVMDRLLRRQTHWIIRQLVNMSWLHNSSSVVNMRTRLRKRGRFHQGINTYLYFVTYKGFVFPWPVQTGSNCDFTPDISTRYTIACSSFRYHKSGHIYRDLVCFPILFLSYLQVQLYTKYWTDTSVDLCPSANYWWVVFCRHHVSPKIALNILSTIHCTL